MKRSIIPTAFAAVLFPMSFAAAAQGAGVTKATDDPLATVQSLFDAMAAHDVEAVRRLVVPGTRFVAVREDGAIHASSDAEFLDALGKDPKSSWRERIWSPEVVVDGAVAQVRAPYDFHLGDEFSHCGTDLFTLARDKDGWRIIAIAYTARKQGCQPPG